MKDTVTVAGRIGLACWMLIAGLMAFASLISTPIPFVLMAFPVAALPRWISLGPRRSLLAALAIATAVAAVPVLILAAYGEQEGGIGGGGAIAGYSLSLGLVALALAGLGLGVGRVVWSPWPEE